MKYILLFFTFLMVFNCSLAQDSAKSNLNVLLTSHFYSEYTTPPKRKILSLENKKIISKINPVTYISAGLLFVYQRVISEQIQADCAYETSCSSYTKFQIEKNGFRGFLLGIDQLSNCFKGVQYDCQEHQISSDSKVINPVEKIDP